MWGALFVSKAFGVYLTHIFDLVVSASDALELESRALSEVLRSAACSGGVSDADPGPPGRSPGPFVYPH